MPLHLLGKKSWNVYNHTNIDRVKADEAAAALRAEERDRLTQEQDAQRRTAILRGEEPPTFAPLSPSEDESSKRPRKRRDGDGDAETGDGYSKDERKRRRKLRGEDETEYEMRIAGLNRAAGDAAKAGFGSSAEGFSVRRRPAEVEKEVDVVDHAGHIQLFAPPDEKQIRHSQKNSEHEAEKKRKERELEDQYTMRFSNAGGFHKDVSAAPWYASAGSKSTELALGNSGTQAAEEVEGKNVWGRPDPARKTRDAGRVSASDPFAFMQKAQGQLRQAEKDREKWKLEKERETRELEKMHAEARRAEKEERRRRRKERESRGDGKSREELRVRHASVDSLEGFALDEPVERKEYRHHSRDDRRRSRERSDKDARSRHRSRSREREHTRGHEHGYSRHAHQHRRRSRSPPR